MAINWDSAYAKRLLAKAQKDLAKNYPLVTANNDNYDNYYDSIDSCWDNADDYERDNKNCSLVEYISIAGMSADSKEQELVNAAAHAAGEAEDAAALAEDAAEHAASVVAVLEEVARAAEKAAYAAWDVVVDAPSDKAFAYAEAADKAAAEAWAAASA